MSVLGEYDSGDSIVRVTITIKGLDSLTKKLDALEKGAYLKPTVTAGANLLRNEMRRYPPKPPQSTYRRQGTLGKSWTQRVSGGRGGWLAVIGSFLNYAPYVQDRDRQAAVHRGRWQTVQSVAEENREKVTRFVVQAIRRWMRG